MTGKTMFSGSSTFRKHNWEIVNPIFSTFRKRLGTTFPGLSTFGKHSWVALFPGSLLSKNIAGRECLTHVLWLDQ